MARDTYEIDPLVKAASNINNSANLFRYQREKIGRAVETIKGYFLDPADVDYIRKYEALQKDLDTLEFIMMAYAKLLKETKAYIDMEACEFRAAALQDNEV